MSKLPVDVIATLDPETADSTVIHSLILAGIRWFCVQSECADVEVYQSCIDKVRLIARHAGYRIDFILSLKGQSVFHGNGRRYESKAPLLREYEFALVQSRELSWVALSFIESAQAIEDVQSLFAAEALAPNIIADLSDCTGIDKREEIITVADGVIFGFSDNVDTLETAVLPQIQKDIIRQCRARLVPCAISVPLVSQGDARLQYLSAIATTQAIIDGASAIVIPLDKNDVTDLVTVTATARAIVSEVKQHMPSHSSVRLGG